MKTFRLPPEWGKKISGNAVSKRIISRTPVLFNCSRLHPRDPLSLSLCVCVCLKWKWKREGERYPSPFTISSEPRQRSPSEGLKGAHPSLSSLGGSSPTAKRLKRYNLSFNTRSFGSSPADPNEQQHHQTKRTGNWFLFETLQRSRRIFKNLKESPPPHPPGRPPSALLQSLRRE